MGCNARPERERRRIAYWALTSLLVILGSSEARVSSAQEARLSIASGVSGGTYRDVYARDLEARLSDHTVIHRLSSGSGENLEMLMDGRADLVFAQADVFAARLREEPDRFGSIRVLGRLGIECLFIAVRKDGPIHSLKELAAPVDGRAAEVAIGPPQGGPAGTWNNLIAMSPELANATAHPVGDRVALRFLERGTFDAVVWVTDPTNFDHRMLRAVRDKAALDLMPINETGLVATLPGGAQVYESGSVYLSKRGSAIPTICTSAVLLVRGDIDPRVAKQAGGTRGLQRMLSD